MTTTAKEDDVEDLNDDDIGIEMINKFFLRILSPLKARSNYN
jgi:hypothetical protein